MMLGRLIVATAALLCALAPVPESQDVTPAQEATPFAPRRYVAYRTAAPIVIDGKLAEPAWAAAPWTDAFVDIEGDSRPRPPLADQGQDALGRRVTSTSPPRWRSRICGQR